jgi:hypothetical protein
MEVVRTTTLSLVSDGLGVSVVTKVLNCVQGATTIFMSFFEDSKVLTV